MSSHYFLVLQLFYHSLLPPLHVSSLYVSLCVCVSVSHTILLHFYSLAAFPLFFIWFYFMCFSKLSPHFEELMRIYCKLNQTKMCMVELIRFLFIPHCVCRSHSHNLPFISCSLTRILIRSASLSGPPSNALAHAHTLQKLQDKSRANKRRMGAELRDMRCILTKVSKATPPLLNIWIAKSKKKIKVPRYASKSK